MVDTGIKNDVSNMLLLVPPIIIIYDIQSANNMRYVAMYICSQSCLIFIVFAILYTIFIPT